jgi:multiple sugar transport system permease protein
MPSGATRTHTVFRRQAVAAWTFLVVPIIFYVGIRLLPTLDAFWLSLNQWNLLSPPHYVGLRNYVRLVHDPVFWKVFGNTVIYLAAGLPISLVLALAIALLLDRLRFVPGLLQALYFLPFLTTAVAMAWVWRWLYQPAPLGLLNDILAWLGLPQQPFLRSTTQALPSALAPAIWAGLGFQIIVFLAGLRAIPNEYYEAAQVDGVSRPRIFLDITLPLLRPTFLFLVVLGSIGFLRIFDQVYNLTTDDLGGPLSASKPLVLMIYQTAFTSFDMGYAAAQTVVLFLALLALSIFQLRAMRDR